MTFRLNWRNVGESWPAADAEVWSLAVRKLEGWGGAWLNPPLMEPPMLR